MKKHLLIGAACLAFLSNGCATTLDLEPMENQSRGVPYVLPFTQFDITVIRRVQNCNKTNIDIGVDVDAKPKTANDPAHAYMMDPESIASFFNRSNFSVEYFENSYQVKSITANAEDQTLPFAAKLATTVAKLVTFPGGSAGASKTACSDDTTNALASVKDLKGKIEKETEIIRSNTIKLEELINARVGMAHNAPLNLTTQIIDLREKLEEAPAQMKEMQDEFNEALALITYVDKYTWPKKGDEKSKHLKLAMDQEVLKGWAGSYPAKDVGQNFDVFLTLHTDAVVSRWAKNKMAETRSAASNNSTVPLTSPITLIATQNLEKGILPYRMGVPGTLTAYLFKVDKAGSLDEPSRVKLKSFDATILQMGRLFNFPVRGKAFESRKTSLVFDKTGGLVSAKIDRKSAPAEAVGTFAETAATQYAAVKTFEHAQEKAAAEAEKGKEQVELDAEIKRLQSLKTLAELQEELSDQDRQRLESIEVMASETTLLQAEIALLEARRALAALH